MKNCDELELGPELAIETTPGPEWRNAKFSSLNFGPQIDSPVNRDKLAYGGRRQEYKKPPVPFPLMKSPPWIMKLGITRWKYEFWYHSGFDAVDFSPVQRHLTHKLTTDLQKRTSKLIIALPKIFSSPRYNIGTQSNFNPALRTICNWNI